MAAPSFAHGGGEGPPSQAHALLQRSRDRHFRSIAGNTIAMTEYPHRASPIIYFVDAGTQQPERIRNPARDAYLFAPASHGFPPAVRLPSSQPLGRPPPGFRTLLHCRGAIWRHLRAAAPHLQNSPAQSAPWSRRSVPLRFWAPAEGPP